MSAEARRSGWLVVCLILAIGAIHLPWSKHMTAGFTMNAFDLAEWSSLHPAVRSGNPPMLTSFLLRLPQIVLAVATVLAAQGWRDARLRGLVWCAAVVLLMRLIPPAEFLTSARDDPNYRQMLLLAALGFGLLGATGLLRGASRRARCWLIATLLVLNVGAAVTGLSRAWELLDHFEIDVALGSGVIGLVVLSLAALVAVLWPIPAPGENKKGG